MPIGYWSDAPPQPNWFLVHYNTCLLIHLPIGYWPVPPSPLPGGLPIYWRFAYWLTSPLSTYQLSPLHRFTYVLQYFDSDKLVFGQLSSVQVPCSSRGAQNEVVNLSAALGVFGFRISCGLMFAFFNAPQNDILMQSEWVYCWNDIKFMISCEHYKNKNKFIKCVKIFLLCMLYLNNVNKV